MYMPFLKVNYKIEFRRVGFDVVEFEYQRNLAMVQFCFRPVPGRVYRKYRVCTARRLGEEHDEEW